MTPLFAVGGAVAVGAGSAESDLLGSAPARERCIVSLKLVGPVPDLAGPVTAAPAIKIGVYVCQSQPATAAAARTGRLLGTISADGVYVFVPEGDGHIAFVRDTGVWTSATGNMVHVVAAITVT